MRKFRHLVGRIMTFCAGKFCHCGDNFFCDGSPGGSFCSSLRECFFCFGFHCLGPGFLQAFLAFGFYSFSLHLFFIPTARRTALTISSAVRPKALNNSSGLPDSPNRSRTPILITGTGQFSAVNSTMAPPNPPRI